MIFRRSLVLFVVALAPVLLLDAGEVEVQHVTAKQSADMLPVKSEAEAIKQYGETVGKQMWQMMAASFQPGYHVFLINNDTERRVTHVELRLRFFNDSAELLGEQTQSYTTPIAPGAVADHMIACSDPVCEQSATLEVEVVGATFVNPKPKLQLAENEFPVKWNGRTWYVENQWESEGSVVVRIFMASAYQSRDFDPRVFAEGSLEADDKLYFRIVQEPIPATYIKRDDLDMHKYYEAPWQHFYTVAGFKVENGKSVKPGAFETGINNLEADLSLEPGGYVRILKTYKGKKKFDLLVAPVCRTVSNHSALRSVFRIALDKAELKRLDPESAERLVRPWLEPVSIAEVSKTCGPNSGTLVKRWDSSTTVADVESQLGMSDVRAETPEGEVVVYGDLKLLFMDGRLGGCERKPPS